MLTFSVKFISLTDTATDTEAEAKTAAEKPDTKVLDADKVGVTYTLDPRTWTGTTSTLIKMSLIGQRPTPIGQTAGTDDDGHWVALVATDRYGESFAHVLRVIVNTPPNTYGPQPMEKDRMRLKDHKGFTDLLATNDANQTLQLTDPTPTDTDYIGFFSDVDGDTLTCENNFLTSEANKAPEGKLFDGVAISTANLLDFDSTGRTGNGWIRIWCSDGFESTPRESTDATLPVHYTRGASIH